LSQFSEVEIRLSREPDRGYRVLIHPGLFQQLESGLSELLDRRSEHWVIITDDRVAPLYLETLRGQIQSRVGRFDQVVVPAGESSKSISQCERVWQLLVACRTDRRTMLVALGGGVVGDLAGFIAATFARGLDFVQIPTTLLAQVDSSVGGKVGINLPQAKNIVGSFWQPRRVIIDPDLLRTLPAREYRCGLAEVVKYGVILDPDFFCFLEDSMDRLRAKDSQVLTQVIHRCCQLKAGVVESDPYETSGLRAILNYGHTYGHAIESVYGYGTWLHGEAVAMGMTCAARLAVELNRLSPEVFDRQTRLLRNLGLPVEIPDNSHDQLLQAMGRDKKVAEGQLNLILPQSLGKVGSVAAPDRSLLLASLQNRFNL
jgi:3-dehydroquinate synthase